MDYFLCYFIALQEATLSSSDEGVCRAARGALWVIKTTTGRSPAKTSGIVMFGAFMSVHKVCIL